MAWIHRVLYGVDSEEDQYRADQAEAALAAENLKDAERYGDAWFAQVTANAARGDLEDASGQVDAAFDEGLREGSANVTAVIRKPFEIAGTAAGSVLKAFPWWLWLAGLAALAFFLWPVLGPALGARLRKS
jgi:hypothetical protein